MSTAVKNKKKQQEYEEEEEDESKRIEREKELEADIQRELDELAEEHLREDSQILSSQTLNSQTPPANLLVEDVIEFDTKNLDRLIIEDNYGQVNYNSIYEDYIQIVHPDKVKQPAENFNFTLQAKNSTCGLCYKDLKDDVAINYFPCKHMQHSICDEKVDDSCDDNNKKREKDYSQCAICILTMPKKPESNAGYPQKNVSTNLFSIEDENGHSSDSSDEDTFGVDMGIDPQKRKRIERKIKMKRLEETGEYNYNSDEEKELISMAETVEEVLSSNKNDDIIVEDKKEITTEKARLSPKKVESLLVKHNILKQKSYSESLVNAWRFTFSSSYVSDDIKQDDLNFTYLHNNKITIDSLEEAEFDIDDIFYGWQITDIRELKQLSLKRKHFNSIFEDFHKFIHLYKCSFTQLDDAITVDWGWLWAKCYVRDTIEKVQNILIDEETQKDKEKNGIELLKKMDIDFSLLIDKKIGLGLTKSVFKKLNWGVVSCVDLGMKKEHMIKMGFDLFDFLEMKSNDENWIPDNIIKIFSLDYDDREKLGISKKILDLRELNKKSSAPVKQQQSQVKQSAKTLDVSIQQKKKSTKKKVGNGNRK